MMWLKIVSNGELIAVNEDNISALTSNYIVLKNGNIVSVSLDMDSVFLGLDEIYKRKSEQERWRNGE